MSYKKRISVKGLFFNEKNEVLLIKGKTLHKGVRYWSAPGGGVDEGESLTEAVERELTEETGYIGQVDNIIFIQDIDFASFVSSERRIQLEIFFRGKITAFDKSIEPDHECKFFSEKELKETLFLPRKLNPFSLPAGLEYHDEKIEIELEPKK